MDQGATSSRRLSVAGSRRVRERDVLQSHLPTCQQLAIAGAGDDHLPQLLCRTLLDWFADHLYLAGDQWPDEIRVVVDPPSGSMMA